MLARAVPLVIIYILVSIMIIVAGMTPLNAVTQTQYEVWKHIMLTWFVSLPILTSALLTIQIIKKGEI